MRRAIPYALALVCAAGFGLPSLAVASGSSGGTGLGSSGNGSGSSGGGSGSTAGGSGSPPPTAQPGNVPVSASGDGMTISTSASGLLRQALTITGSVPSGEAGSTIQIEISGLKTHWAWQPVTTATVQSNGAFSAVWATNHIGRFSLRAVPGSSSGASPAAGAPTVSVIVYRPSLATLYGPGFWGRRTACGIVLRRNTIGLANRTLPCGTPVAIDYQGQTLVVPVIDRGPYAHGADWDLTMATGKALGMTGTATLGATSLPSIR